MVLSGLSVSAPFQISVVELFSSWEKGISEQEWKTDANVKIVDWKKVWQLIPKYIWWKLWLVRNDGIFSNKQSTPAQVASTIKFLITESIGNSSSLSMLPDKVNEWLGKRNMGNSKFLSHKLCFSLSWKIRCLDAKFANSWKKSSSASIFFTERLKEIRAHPGLGGC